MSNRALSPLVLGGRRLSLALALAALPALAVPAWSQDAPPPETKVRPKKPTPRPPKGGGGGSAPTGGGTAPAAPPTLLIQSDMNGTVTIDGDKSYKVKANEISRIQVPVGEHLLHAVSDDGKRSLDQVVKASGSGTMVVQIALSSAVAATNPEEFDRAAARVWVALDDMLVAGQHVGKQLNKNFGFHDKTLTTTIYTAHQSLKRQVEEFKKFTPGDPSRQRIATELVRAAAEADKYVELMAQTISTAQQSNSWYGQPLQMYGQAKALETSLVPAPPIVNEMKASAALVSAVPGDHRARLGLARDSRDFDLGAQAFV
ncbi:MAG TPA: hypothetical protein VFO85_02345, partial [Vicinamibacteria bacterium]|nr:hypothetical protein [Vicinamibacteria bacterium]